MVPLPNRQVVTRLFFPRSTSICCMRSYLVLSTGLSLNVQPEGVKLLKLMAILLSRLHSKRGQSFLPLNATTLGNSLQTSSQFSLHLNHPRLLVSITEPLLRQALYTKPCTSLATYLFAALEQNIDHASMLVRGAEPSP